MGNVGCNVSSIPSLDDDRDRLVSIPPPLPLLLLLPMLPGVRYELGNGDVAENALNRDTPISPVLLLLLVANGGLGDVASVRVCINGEFGIGMV